MMDLRGKHALVFGVASETSLAWGIAKRVQQLVRSAEVPVPYWERCDVANPEEVASFFAGVNEPVDIVVHSIAYTNPETFAQPVSQVSQQDFSTALVASAYSLIPLVRAALPKMTRGGSVLAMSYLGGQRVVANYKVMGIAKAALEATVRELAVEVGQKGVRVNAISAGPVKTLAASQISGFDDMLRVYEQVSPMRSCITQEDVANLAAFLGSDLARNITGQTIFVDAGYSALAMAELPVEGASTSRIRAA
jgi:enoyl-[acyl-carrier protein] reductase I